MEFPSSFQKYLKNMYRNPGVDVFNVVMAGIGFGVFAFAPVAMGWLAFLFFIPVMLPGIHVLLTGTGEERFYEDVTSEGIEAFCETYIQTMATKGLMPADSLADSITLANLYNMGDTEGVVHAVFHMLNKMEEIDGIHDLQQAGLPTVRPSEEPAEGQGA